MCGRGRGGVDTCLACRRCPEMGETWEKSIIQSGKNVERGTMGEIKSPVLVISG